MAKKASGKAANSAASDARRQVIKTMIQQCLKENFGNTLGTETDIVNIVLALAMLESHFNVNAMGPMIPTSLSSGARDYRSSTAIQNIEKTGSAAQKANLDDGQIAMGVMQIMGWNVIRGAGKQGKCEIERIRPDLVSSLCVNPGDSVRTKYLGESNLHTVITCGLAVLESKWKAVKKIQGGYQIGKMVFSSRIEASVAAYLGLGAKDVRTGITPQQYASSIVGGSTYKLANGELSPAVRDSRIQLASATTSGATNTSASGRTQVPPGCIKA